MLFKRLALLALFMTLSGCINSPSMPQSYYYILDASPATYTETLHTSAKKQAILKQVKVRTLTLPDYMQQPNLVLKLSNHQIKIANYHFWAEDLKQSIQRILIKELNQASSATSYHQTCSKCDEIAITIDHFYPTEQGQVLLLGTYDKIGMDGSQSTRSFSFVKNLRKGGYDEAVEAMRALLGDLAKHIP